MRWLLLPAVAWMLLGCQAGARPLSAPPARPLADIVRAYDADITPYHPFTASEAGLRQYDRVLANDIGAEYRGGMLAICTRYRDELARLAEKDPTIEVTHTLTREQPDGWTGFKRRIDREMLEAVAWPPSEQPRVFVCGPTPLVEAVANNLVELGHQPAFVKTERFGPTGGSV